MVSNFVDAPHTYVGGLDNMVVSKMMPSRYKNGRAEVPRSVKYNFCYPYFLYHIRDGRIGKMEEFIFYNLSLEKAFRLALRMEAEKDPLFIEVAKWNGYKVDEEATA
jgi:hypothetical protein